MRCRDAQEKLAEYSDDALGARQRDAVAAHLRGCGSCRSELERLHQSLAALNAASSAPAPDLWVGFQARLAAETRALPCSAACEMLPAYLEGELEPERDRALRRHLGDCAACAAEETLLCRSLQALDLAPLVVRTPDLWPGFSAGLSRSARCADIEAWLPAYLESELDGPRALRVQAHLQECPRCGSQEQGLLRALSVLEHAGRPSEIDLWPAFAERLAREPVPPHGNLHSAIGALRSAVRRRLEPLRGPMLGPALGLAAAAAAALLFAGSPRPQAPPAGPLVAGVPVELTPNRSTGNNTREEIHRSDPTISAVRNDAPARHVAARHPVAQLRTRPRAGRFRTSLRSRQAPRPDDSLLARGPAYLRLRESGRTVVGEGRPLPVDQPAVQGSRGQGGPALAGNRQDPGNAPDAVSAHERDEVMPQVVEVARLLASLDDAASRPFDTNLNEQ